jgi:dTMP kinase
MKNDGGLFIVFEGIDGSGSSTQAELLKEELKAKAHSASEITFTTEPTSGPIGHLIREIMTGRLRTSNNPLHDDRLLAYLFAADRQDHLYNSVNGIVNRLQRGEVVISTRYFLSSLAYHSSTEHEYQLVKMMNDDFVLPNITFYLDCPVDIAVERLKRRSHLEKYENVEKLKEVSSAYKKAIGDYQGQIEVIDGTLPIQTIRNIINQTINSVINGFANDRKIIRFGD